MTMSKKTEDGRGFPQEDATGGAGTSARTGKCPYEHGFELADEPDGTNRYRIVLLHDGKVPILVSTFTDEHGDDVQQAKVEAAPDVLCGLMISLTYAQEVLGVRFPDPQAMADAIEGVVERR